MNHFFEVVFMGGHPIQYRTLTFLTPRPRTPTNVSCSSRLKMVDFTRRSWKKCTFSQNFFEISTAILMVLKNDLRFQRSHILT